ncbi:MAG: hypothetical protein JJ900_04675 [Rhodospirillales bacterium]|nr:hypothetical protein [Rhodospirillales bacterium]MBO6786125.1 hypothetical protein [Rhodospirillales bacterium]
MSDEQNILISVEERHTLKMLAGAKTVELRRKPLNIDPGTRVWIYSKLPRGQIHAFATARDVVSGPPAEIWSHYGTMACVSKREFDTYFDDLQTGYAIILEDVAPLSPGLALATIRETVSRFQPPQFFKRLSNDGPELQLFQTALAQA